MSGYSWISVLSLFCYLFLFLTFLVAEKSKKVIYTFMMLLVVMILWNGGSFCMRMQLWPSVNFWHHVSLLGMLMLPVGYYHFVLDFLEERGHGGKIFWGPLHRHPGGAAPLLPRGVVHRHHAPLYDAYF